MEVWSYFLGNSRIKLLYGKNQYKKIEHDHHSLVFKVLR